MRIAFGGQSISRKLMAAVLATTLIALLVAATAIIAFEIHSFRTMWVNDLNSQAGIIGQASTAAIEFDDRKAATEDLRKLQLRPRIDGAALYDANGNLFATYLRDPAAAGQIPPRAGPEGYASTANRITVSRAIVHQGETIGHAYIGADYPLGQRVSSYVGILAVATILGMAVAMVVSYWLQRAITDPIRALTDAAGRVVERRDFTHQVPKSTQDEIGVLVDAFNAMVAEAGRHTEALETTNQALQHEMTERISAETELIALNNSLEERIAERTRELQQAYEALRQSQKLEAIGQLTGGVAHDFNNLLQVISGNLQLLQPVVRTDSQALARLGSAASAVDRGAKLAMQLLAFARRQPLQPVPSNLARIVRGMDDLLRRALGDDVVIETVIAGGLWNTLVDRSQIENVILNLAINARDAMEGGGRLTLELSNTMLDEAYVLADPDLVPGQYVMLAVSDTGKGMTPEVKARAFDPFFTTKSEGRGTGLGLSTVYGFVKQSSGHIRIYSEPDNGTTIKIYLPRVYQMEAPTEPVRTIDLVGGSETILVVEDDLAVQNTVVDMLSGLGYRVLRADNGDSALNILKSGLPIDLLFTDVVMPGKVTSPELARQAKELLPEVIVLFTSGYTQNAIVHGGRLDPGVELISKPYRREDLARKIRMLFAERNKDVPTPSAPIEPPDHLKAVVTPRSLNILVVEDNPDGLEMACQLLSALGHAPHGTGSAEAALEFLKTTRVDLLVTDISLPGMSGEDLARQVRTLAPELPVVFASGFSMQHVDAGSSGLFLQKPYSLKDLQVTLIHVENMMAGVRPSTSINT